ncbi:MAG: glycosyltransferase family 2 protein [Candidatus Undinarchaeales archaeon]|jgi:glycosyltransferase involved in cell wall biosynthesis|nr:glycosyltransferase family 2 protein [Candidatus Undinarchaeales archaeon]MDP7491463.1 glycosyltransferase family 2 protein [Candidatus Undinarchaeales archaeon]
MATISVVIPVYNGAVTLGACLKALTGSDTDDDVLEVIVVDDGSTDSSADLAEGLGVRVVRLERNSGPATARNRGAAASSGDVVVFLDADMQVKQGTISALAERVNDPSIGAVFCPYDPTTKYDHKFATFVNLLYCFWFSNHPVDSNVLVGSAMAMRREVFEANRFDECFSRASVEDIELGWALLSRGLRIVLAKDLPVSNIDEVAPMRFWRSRYHIDRCWVKAYLRHYYEQGSSFRPFNAFYHPVNVVLLTCFILLIVISATGAIPTGVLALVGPAIVIWNLPFLAFALRYTKPLIAVEALLHAFSFPLIHVSGLTVGTLQWIAGDRIPCERDAAPAE